MTVNKGKDQQQETSDTHGVEQRERPSAGDLDTDGVEQRGRPPTGAIRHTWRSTEIKTDQRFKTERHRAAHQRHGMQTERAASRSSLPLTSQ